MTNATYQIKVVVTDKNVKCYLNNTLYVDYTIEEGTNAEAYQVVSEDENGDMIIKLVNVTGDSKIFAVDIKGSGALDSRGSVDIAVGRSMADDNILGRDEVVSMNTSEITGISSQFNFTTPPYSVIAIRLSKKS